MSSARQKVRGRPAHPPGAPTSLAYSNDGSKLITAGSNNVVRIFETGSDGEPTNLDDCQENNLAVAATDDYFLTGSEDGMVCKYSLHTNEYDSMIVRFSLPIRDIAISPDGRLAACCSDEIPVKVVDMNDTMNIFQLDDHPRPVKHLSFDKSGTYLSASCSDGIVYIYSFSTQQPKVIQRIEDVTRPLETDSEASSQVDWHPDGRTLAAPGKLGDVVVLSDAGQVLGGFKNEHVSDVRAIAWSPNGALLATADNERILLWDTKSQTRVTSYDYDSVYRIVWHPSQNLASFSTTGGEVFIHKDFVPPEHVQQLSTAVKGFQNRPPLSEVSGNLQRATANGGKLRRPSKEELDDLDSLLDADGGYDDFVVDDDGAGYALNGNGKRPRGVEDADGDGHEAKRQELWEPEVHRPFQPGSTPWRGNRRYLCLNLTGFVWTVDQDTHHTVTCEFYDREEHRDFHFTDPYRYDKACLNESGALFACPSRQDHRAMIYYRPHETWTARADWRTELPAGEEITAIALSDSFVTVTTTANYVRIYTLFGTAFRIYRQKSTPTVTCAAWRDYVLTMGNGPVGADGTTKLVYSIENVRRDEICQNEDVVALPEDTELRSVFFSDKGDPCIYDTQGVLLVLQHWRTPGQARWVPLLDTKMLERLATGRKEESYWPVAVAQDKFHCIILKGGDQYPYFPRPLLTEFDFRVPVTSTEDTSQDQDGPRLEETFVRTSLMHSLMEDLTSSTHASHTQRADLARAEVEVDKTLLQLINVECREGEDRGMKALEIVQLLRDRSGKMLEAAGKIASRHGQSVLEDKIRDIAERRLSGDEDNEGFS